MEKIIQQYPVLKSKQFLALIICGVLILTETGILIGQSVKKRHLESDLTDLNEELIQLQTERDELQGDYDNLTQDYELESALRIGNLLASFYDDLRSALGPTGGSWALTDQQYWADTAEFATNL